MAVPNHQLAPTTADEQALCACRPATPGSGIDFAAVFEASTTAQAVLSTSFDFLSVNEAFAALVRRPPQDLLGHNVFEAFSGNSDDAEDNGPARLRASLERVVASGEPDDMFIQRYDVVDHDRPDVFEERYWRPVNNPICDAGGRVIAVLHRVEDVTAHRQYLTESMQRFHLAVGESNDRQWDRRFIEFMTAALDGYVTTSAAQMEVEQLKHALSSRADIDQAKGILMATHRCDAETAFQLLVKMSNNANIKLREVVAAILYKTVQPDNTVQPPS